MQKSGFSIFHCLSTWLRSLVCVCTVTWTCFLEHLDQNVFIRALTEGKKTSFRQIPGRKKRTPCNYSNKWFELMLLFCVVCLAQRQRGHRAIPPCVHPSVVDDKCCSACFHLHFSSFSCRQTWEVLGLNLKTCKIFFMHVI